MTLLRENVIIKLNYSNNVVEIKLSSTTDNDKFHYATSQCYLTTIPTDVHQWNFNGILPFLSSSCYDPHVA